MKKLLSILAVLAIVLTCCIMGIGTAFAAPAESAEEDFLAFDGVLEEYIGAGGDVVIPASLGIKEIAARSFYDNSDITSLVIPEGVETIGSKAFCSCENLAEIILPYSLTELSEHEFSGCAITELTIPGNCEVVSYGCFSNCAYLTKLTLSYGVREILPLAFQGTSIEKIVFPETVELICGGSSFGHNKNADEANIEYYICNPDCEIGSSVTGSQKALKHEWTEVNSPWSHNKRSAQYRIYVIEGSEVDKFLTEQGETLLKAIDSGRDDTLKLFRKEEQYFKDLPENQPGYGTPKPTTSTDSTTEGNGNEGSDGSDGDGSDGGSGSSNTNGSNTNKNNQNGTGGQTVITQSGDNTALIIVVAVIGGVMLLAVIAVIILAATGVLFGKKPAKAAEPEEDPEMAAIKAELAAAKKAKELEALKAELAALKGEETPEE